VLETLVKALPHAYRDTPATEGTSVNFVIEGPAGGTWSVQRRGVVWKLRKERETAAATVWIDQDAAWRLFTKGLNSKTVNARIEGDAELGRVALRTVAVMG